MKIIIEKWSRCNMLPLENMFFLVLNLLWIIKLNSMMFYFTTVASRSSI